MVDLGLGGIFFSPRKRDYNSVYCVIFLIPEEKKLKLLSLTRRTTT